MVDRWAVDARATAARTRQVERAGWVLGATSSHDGSRHTTPDTWAITLAKPSVRAWLLSTHDVSKPSVTVASWRAERMGPMTIGAPHRGQCQGGGVEDVSEGIETR